MSLSLLFACPIDSISSGFDSRSVGWNQSLWISFITGGGLLQGWVEKSAEQLENLAETVRNLLPVSESAPSLKVDRVCIVR